MNKARTVVGAHAFFIPEGAAFTSPEAGTVGREEKPDNEEVTWFNLGVGDWAFAPQNTIEDFIAPAPGMRQLHDRIATKVGLKLKGTWKELSNLVYQLLLATATLPNSPTAGGQYNPMEGDPVVRGWLNIQQYNQKNVKINTLEVYVALTIPGEIAFDDKLIDTQVEADVLQSTLNTGTLT